MLGELMSNQKSIKERLDSRPCQLHERQLDELKRFQIVSTTYATIAISIISFVIIPFVKHYLGLRG